MLYGGGWFIFLLVSIASNYELAFCVFVWEYYIIYKSCWDKTLRYNLNWYDMTHFILHIRILIINNRMRMNYVAMNKYMESDGWKMNTYSRQNVFLITSWSLRYETDDFNKPLLSFLRIVRTHIFQNVPWCLKLSICGKPSNAFPRPPKKNLTPNFLISIS